MRKPNRKSNQKTTHTFSPLQIALERIRAHFDERAHIAYNTAGDKEVRYYIEDGTRITLSEGGRAKLVYRKVPKEFTMEQAKQLAKDLEMSEDG